MEISNLVLKVTCKCNLNCSYCYVFNKGDKSFEKEPPFIDLRTSEKLLYRLSDHIKRHKIKEFLIIFHGGEPLLIGKKFYIDFIALANKIVTEIQLNFALQTNGTLLNKVWSKLFRDLNISIGVSIDGTPLANKNRLYRNNGVCAYNDILNGINALKQYNNEIAVLSVVNVEENPLNVYNHLKEIGITHASFLFPDLNYEHIQDQVNVPKIGDWLIEIFDLWYNDNGTKPMLRPFNFLCLKILGFSELGNEMFGTNENSVLTIKTNGNIESVDSLRICGNGFTNTNINIFTNELDDFFDDDLFKNYYYAHKDVFLSDQCTVCEIKEICGGSQLAHRFSKNNGFKNPSIYCKEIYKLIEHIQNKLFSDLPESIINDCNIRKIGSHETF